MGKVDEDRDSTEQTEQTKNVLYCNVLSLYLEVLNVDIMRLPQAIPVWKLSYNICEKKKFLMPSMAREEARADTRFLISMQKNIK